VHGQFADEIGSAVLAREIEQGTRRIETARDEVPDEIAHVPAGCAHLGEAGAARRIGAALADREGRQREQGVTCRIVGDCRRRVGAGDDHRAPIAGQIRWNRLDAHQRRD
jgi:hypothetical protein